MVRVWLDVPPAMSDYCEQQGAQHDRNSRKWYVDGEVPPTLENFVVRAPRERKRDYSHKCPLCGGHLMERHRIRDGELFLGCSSFPSCKFTTAWPYEESGNVIDALPNSFIGTNRAPKDAATTTTCKDSSEALRPRWEALIKKAQDHMGEEEANRWLVRPLPYALRGRRPVDLLLQGKDGFDRFNQLLDSFNKE